MWFYRFPAPIILSVSGKDAVRYSHNRLSNDVRGLAIGAGCVAGALTAQGRVQALFTVLRINENQLTLIADGGDAEIVKTAFTQFIVADRVNVEDVSSKWVFLHVAIHEGLFTEMISELQSVLSRETRRGTSAGWDVLISAEEWPVFSERLTQPDIKELRTETYTLQRILASVPTFPDEVNDTIILTECGRSDVVMFGKGCYVGQEVIEKIDAVGRLPRELKRLSCPGNHKVEIGSAVLRGAQSVQIGRIVSQAYDETSNLTWFFAYLKNGQVSGGDRVSLGEHPVSVV